MYISRLVIDDRCLHVSHIYAILELQLRVVGFTTTNASTKMPDSQTLLVGISLVSSNSICTVGRDDIIIIV